MIGFLRKLFGRRRKSQNQPTGDYANLLQFYTNTEHARQVFEQLVSATNTNRRLLVIHGLGGVGKSTLLKMYRFSCDFRRIPVALVASEEAHSPVEVLAGWTEELGHFNIPLPAFQKTLNSFRTIQAKVESEAAKTGLAGTVGKAAALTVIGIATSAIPIVGPLASAVGSASAEAFIDWLHNFLTKPDLELYLDPVKRLTRDFLSDLSSAASRQRIVLITDTYEQMTALDDWMCQLAKKLPASVLLVIAGRTIPQWDRTWQEWLGNAEIIELKEMSPDDLRALVHRYYAYIRSGTPDPKEVEDIVQFARGLPMVATTVVQLWVKYHVEDFQAVRPHVVADLVDRLLEGVPQEMRPAFEAAAVLRYFNVEALSALLDDGNTEGLYAELRRWPFVRSRREGLSVHDTMREMINEALYARSPERFRTLHERAAGYYETLLAKATGDERERYGLERLYHRIRADEAGGMQMFREIAEEFTRYGLVNRLRALLNDVNAYPLERPNSQLWRMYYQARLKDLERQQSEAVQLYQVIADNPEAEEILRAYALCDWAWIERSTSFETFEEILERVRELFPDPEALPGPDVKLGLFLIEFGELYKVQGKWRDALTYLERARGLYEKINDLYWIAFTDNRIKYYYLEHGEWEKGLEMQQRGLQEIAKLVGEQQSFIRVELLGGYSTYWMWAGQYRETEKSIREALRIAEKLERVEQQVYLMRDLALVLGLQGKFPESTEVFTKVIEVGSPQDPYFEAVTSGYQGILALKSGGAAEAEHYLIPSMNMFSQKSNKIWYFPPLLNSFAVLQEMKGEMSLAAQYYQERINLKYLEHWYWHAGALAGLARVYTATENIAGAISAIQDAIGLMEQYQFYDQLASIRLTQGHLIWSGKAEIWGHGIDGTLPIYQEAMVNALRHNRFTLEEILIGLEHGTLLQPIIPECLNRGEEGRQMLQALHDWWQTGTNGTDTRTHTTKTFSPVPEGITLIEGEQRARQIEPGDGSIQKTVLEHFAQALGNKNGEGVF